MVASERDEEIPDPATEGEPRERPIVSISNGEKPFKLPNIGTEPLLYNGTYK